MLLSIRMLECSWLDRYSVKHDSFWRRLVVARSREGTGGWCFREVKSSQDASLWNTISNGLDVYIKRNNRILFYYNQSTFKVNFLISSLELQMKEAKTTLYSVWRGVINWIQVLEEIMTCLQLDTINPPLVLLYLGQNIRPLTVRCKWIYDLRISHKYIYEQIKESCILTAKYLRRRYKIKIRLVIYEQINWEVIDHLIWDFPVTHNQLITISSPWGLIQHK